MNKRLHIEKYVIRHIYTQNHTSYIHTSVTLHTYVYRGAAMCYTMFRSMMVCVCHVDPTRLFDESILQTDSPAILVCVSTRCNSNDVFFRIIPVLSRA